MKISNRDLEFATFSNLACGDVFYHYDDNTRELYMKITAIEDSDCNQWNAVRLSDGNADEFAESASVIFVNGEYTID